MIGDLLIRAVPGVSSGALVMYEVALELQRRAMDPPFALYILSEESPALFVEKGNGYAD